MYLNRVIINGRLTKDPEYIMKRGTTHSEEYCILYLHCQKPIKIKETKSREDVYFEVHAFGKNAQSIKGKVFQGKPLLFECEVRNIVQGDNTRATILQAVKIHFHETAAPRRLDSNTQSRNSKSVPKETEKEKVEELPEKELPEELAQELAEIALSSEASEEEVTEEKNE